MNTLSRRLTRYIRRTVRRDNTHLDLAAASASAKTPVRPCLRGATTTKGSLGYRDECDLERVGFAL